MLCGRTAVTTVFLARGGKMVILVPVLCSPRVAGKRWLEGPLGENSWENGAIDG